MAKRRSTKQFPCWFLLLVILIYVACQYHQKRVSNAPLTENSFKNVSIVSVYDGDTFKIDLDCAVELYCRNMPVRVLGVDTPEIKGKTEREKKLAQQAKKFTTQFLQKGPVTLSNCGRDKYFRLLCDVTNGEGQNLAAELIKRNLGYSYDGGTKSDQYQ